MAAAANPMPGLLQSLSSLLLDDWDGDSSCSNAPPTPGSAAPAAAADGQSLEQLLHDMLLVRC
jgi:hypothetical protein